MIKPSARLATILATDLGIDPKYRHTAKQVTPGEMLETSGAVLKWYAVHPEDRPVPDDITQSARAYLLKTPLEARGLGFVVLHRCGNDFYFLIVCAWRGSNEVWETVFYKNADAMLDFALFTRDKTHKRRSAFGNWLPSGMSNTPGSDFSNQPETRPRRRPGSTILIPVRLESQSVWFADLKGQIRVRLWRIRKFGEITHGLRRCDSRTGGNGKRYTRALCRAGDVGHRPGTIHTCARFGFVAWENAHDSQ